MTSNCDTYFRMKSFDYKSEYCFNVAGVQLLLPKSPLKITRPLTTMKSILNREVRTFRAEKTKTKQTHSKLTKVRANWIVHTVLRQTENMATTVREVILYCCIPYCFLQDFRSSLNPVHREMSLLLFCAHSMNCFISSSHGLPPCCC